MTSTTHTPGVPTRPQGSARRRLTVERRRAVTAYLFLAPALLVLLTFVIWPVLRSLWTAMTDDSGFGSADFIGLDNFVAAFSDDRFLGAFANTAVYAVCTVPLSVGIALLLAVILNRKIPFRGFFRAAFFFPFIASLGIISIAWSYMLDPQIGFVSAWLAELGVPIGNGIRDPALAMPAVIVVGIWRNIGFFMVMYLAGLQSIPTDVKEAASIDGAGPVRTFRSITWPLVSNTTMFVSIIAVIFALQAFDQIYVMTNGGPYFHTETLVMLIFKTGIEQFQLGYASAMSWVLVAVVLVVSLVQMRYFQKRTVQY